MQCLPPVSVLVACVLALSTGCAMRPSATEADGREPTLDEQRQTVSGLVREAEKRIKLGEYDAALEVIRRITALDPANDYAAGVGPLLVELQSSQNRAQPAMAQPPSPDEGTPERVKAIPCLSSLRLLPDGLMEFAAPQEPDRYGVRCRVVTWREGWRQRVTVAQGESVYIGTIDIMGAGSRWYEFLGEKDGWILLRERTSFHGIEPDTSRLIEVKPYASTRPATA